MRWSSKPSMSAARSSTGRSARNVRCALGATSSSGSQLERSPAAARRLAAETSPDSAPGLAARRAKRLAAIIDHESAVAAGERLFDEESVARLRMVAWYDPLPDLDAGIHAFAASGTPQPTPAGDR